MHDERKARPDDMHKPSPGDEHVDAAIELLRTPVVVDAEAFDARVLKAVSSTPPLHLVRSPRARAIRAARLIAVGLAATLLVAVGLRERNRIKRADHPAVATRVGTPGVETQVRFRLTRAAASQVAVVGSFNAWSATATPLHRVGDSTWVADVPLPAGRYVYQFVIDEHAHVPDPDAPLDPADDFGTRNSVLTVLPRSGS